MSPCETLRQLLAGETGSTGGAGTPPSERDGFCAIAGRYCAASTYAGYAVPEAARRCPGRTFLVLAVLAAAAKAQQETSR